MEQIFELEREEAREKIFDLLTKVQPYDKVEIAVNQSGEQWSILHRTIDKIVIKIKDK